jgi:hypothetical protein
VTATFGDIFYSRILVFVRERFSAPDTATTIAATITITTVIIQSWK